MGVIEDDRRRYALLALALVVIAAAILAIEAPWREGSTVPEPPEDAPESVLDEPGAPNFAGTTGWLNGGPVNLTDQRGEVVLVDFWTYSCINCIHTFPHLRAWHDHYGPHGLEVVGVHTPEFRFERDPANVRDAVERYNLSYPVALDNDYEIWDAYHVQFWPSKYLVDQYGRVQYAWAGEGGYHGTEEEIRRLLRDANRTVPESWVNVSATGGWTGRQTPELFAAPIDEHTTSAIGNREDYPAGDTVDYELPAEIGEDQVYLEGSWYHGNESVTARSGDARILLDFRAGAANTVAGGPGECARVLLDGEPINRSHAARDVTFEDGTPCVTVEEQRSYDLYAGPVERHLLDLDVPEGFQLYTFAFSKTGRE